MSGRLWHAKDVAAYLGVAVKTVYRLPVPCIVLGKRSRRYDPDMVKSWVAKQSRVLRVAA